MKQEHIIDVISILLTIILLYALILAVKTFYVPAPLDIAELSDYQPLLLAAPEPVEFMQYVLGVLCTPAFLWFSYSTTRHLLRKQSNRLISREYYVISLISDLVMNQVFWVGVFPGISKEMLEYMVEVFHRGVKQNFRVL